MRTEHHGDGVTTYVYGLDTSRTAANVIEIRQSVERIEVMCRDILTALNLLIDVLQVTHGESDEGGDSRL